MNKDVELITELKLINGLQAQSISGLAKELDAAELKVVAQQARIVELVRVARIAKGTILDLSPCGADYCKQFQTEDVVILEKIVDVALLKTDDLSALKEHEAGVIEEAAGKFDGSVGYNLLCADGYANAWDIASELRYMADEKRA